MSKTARVEGLELLVEPLPHISEKFKVLPQEMVSFKCWSFVAPLHFSNRVRVAVTKCGLVDDDDVEKSCFGKRELKNV